MMKRQKTLISKIRSAVLAGVFFAGVLVSGTGPITHAAVSCVKQGANEKTSFKWAADGCADTTDLINTVIKFFSAIVGLAVVGGIMYGGFLYATANGSSSKTQQGIAVIVNAVIGLLVYIFLFALTNFLVPGGIIG
jgi:hypothetical protein